MSDGPILLINAALSDAAELRVRDVLPSLTVVTSAELRDRPAWLAEAEILFTHHIEPSSVGQAPKLRWIQTFGAGVEWLLTPELRARRDLVVTNARGIHAQPIAEHVFGFILMFARRLHHSVVAQTEARWDSGLREGLGTLAGSTLGILGFGSIGRKIAEIGRAFGMRIVALRRHAEPERGVERVFGPDELATFLGESNYVVNALPLTGSTRNLLGARELRAMRPDAVLINIGRGATIQTDALVDALRERRIAGAALDVTAPEPLPAEHPLWGFDNVVISPHYAGAHPGYADHVSGIFVDNLRRYLAGQPLTNVVDKEAGY
jgi:D-2-hydroxyacid dehydrogenase (NADP+)